MTKSRTRTGESGEVHVTISTGGHSIDMSPISAMKDSLEELFRLSGITGSLKVTAGPYVQQSKFPGISYMGFDDRSVTVRVQVPEFHRFCYKFYLYKPPYFGTNEEFGSRIQNGIAKLERLQKLSPRRRQFGKQIREDQAATTLDLEISDSLQSPEEQELLTEEAFALALLKEEQLADKEAFFQIQKELHDAEQSIRDELEKLRGSRDQDKLHKLHVLKSRTIPWLSSLQNRMHTRESKIQVLERNFELEHTRVARFQDAKSKLSAILTRDEFAEFAEYLKM